MNSTQRISHLVLLLSLTWVGCSPNLPTSQSDVDIERVYQSPFDKTWNSVLKVAEASNGVLVTQDKSSGMIVYSVVDSVIAAGSKQQVYMSVYLRGSQDRNSTTVYLFPKVRGAYYLKEIDQDFFLKLENILKTE
jgi:hypothetical protein